VYGLNNAVKGIDLVANNKDELAGGGPACSPFLGGRIIIIPPGYGKVSRAF
jgi:hypothetical protein